jgi:hypothetical protein
MSYRWIPYSIVGQSSTNATVLKAAPGRVGFIAAFNVASTPVYLKLYNKAITPTESDTPVQRYTIPGNTAGAGFVLPVPLQGIDFTAGIAYRLVTGAADTSTSAVTANEQLINIGYV